MEKCNFKERRHVILQGWEIVYEAAFCQILTTMGSFQMSELLLLDSVAQTLNLVNNIKRHSDEWPLISYSNDWWKWASSLADRGITSLLEEHFFPAKCPWNLLPPYCPLIIWWLCWQSCPWETKRANMSKKLPAKTIWSTKFWSKFRLRVKSGDAYLWELILIWAWFLLFWRQRISMGLCPLMKVFLIFKVSWCEHHISFQETLGSEVGKIPNKDRLLNTSLITQGHFRLS